jgi:hypothetical protein
MNVMRTSRIVRMTASSAACTPDPIVALADLLAFEYYYDSLPFLPRSPDWCKMKGAAANVTLPGCAFA